MNQETLLELLAGIDLDQYVLEPNMVGTYESVAEIRCRKHRRRVLFDSYGCGTVKEALAAIVRHEIGEHP